MSNSDGFIDEVTEEVRKEKLYGYLRRYGWIAAIAVIGLVGGTAYNEIAQSRAAQAAQARGDALLDALETADDTERADQLSALVQAGDSSVAAQFLAASELVFDKRPADAVRLYEAVGADAELDPLYRDLAALKAAMLDVDGSAEDRRRAFEAIAAPGAPYRTLAEEQLALLEISGGQVDAALARLQNLVLDAEASEGLQSRAVQLIVALGGTPELANTPLADTDNGG